MELFHVLIASLLIIVPVSSFPESLDGIITPKSKLVTEASEYSGKQNFENQDEALMVVFRSSDPKTAEKTR